MQDIEPFYNWRELYISSEDVRSPFYEREYSEFEYTHTIYNYYIHPQWDFMGSPTLFIKIIFADYESGFAIIELIGEWNDAINNDIMILKRDIVDELIRHGINKFILVGENVLNFHSSDDCYYEEWLEDLEDGWIVGLNFRDHVLKEMSATNIDYYVTFGGELNDMNWRTFSPFQLVEIIERIMGRRLGTGTGG
ncbi:MAG: hypothetical protein POELPBGB_03879 [Bacteroidia bacterium]|nr:hypothetical protein [Bacteroidia bacterium]